MPQSIAEQIAHVQGAIADAAKQAGRDTASVRLLAVSKKQSIDKLRAAYAAGLRDFGENYVQGLEEHRDGLAHSDVRWHYIGHLQSNKAKRVVEGVYLNHSVDSLKLARRLARLAGEAATTLRVLINVNISQQSGKAGIAPSELTPLLDDLSGLPELNVCGLMCIPDPTAPPRGAFAQLRELRNRAARQSDFPLPELSMGMSDSFVDAILEGATIVRVGTRIFGTRSAP